MTAAYGLYFAIKAAPETSFEEFYKYVQEKADYLNTSRPTAVNLSWVLQRMFKKIENVKKNNIADIKKYCGRKLK